MSGDNYDSSKITVLKGLDAVRKRPRHGKQQAKDYFDQPVRAEVIRPHQYREQLSASRTMQEPDLFLRA